MVLRAVMTAAFLATAAGAFAQTAPATSPAIVPGQDDALAGPTVSERETRPTLVKRDFNGALIRPEVSAEEAALELIDLTEEEQTAVRKVLDERAAILDSVVAENLDLLIQFQGAKDGNTESVRAIQQFVSKLGPLRERGRLVEELAAVLPEEKGRQLRDLNREYWRALIQDETEKARKAGEDPRPGRIMAAEGLKAFGLEVRRSYERRVVSGTKELDEFLERMAFSPETEGKVRKILQDHFQETLGRPTDAQKREMVAEIFMALKPDERARALREIYSGREVTPKGAGEGKEGRRMGRSNRGG